MRRSALTQQRPQWGKSVVAEVARPDQVPKHAGELGVRDVELVGERTEEVTTAAERREDRFGQFVHTH